MMGRGDFPNMTLRGRALIAGGRNRLSLGRPLTFLKDGLRCPIPRAAGALQTLPRGSAGRHVAQRLCCGGFSTTFDVAYLLRTESRPCSGPAGSPRKAAPRHHAVSRCQKGARLCRKPAAVRCQRETHGTFRWGERPRAGSSVATPHPIHPLRLVLQTQSRSESAAEAGALQTLSRDLQVA